MRNNFWIMIHLRIIIQRSSRTNSQSTKFVNICKNSLWDHSSSHLFMICENSPFPCLLTINWTHCLTSISNLVKIPIPYLEFIHPTRCESSSSQKIIIKKRVDPGHVYQASATGTFFKRKGFKNESAEYLSLETTQIPYKPCSDPIASTTTSPRCGNIEVIQSIINKPESEFL